MTCIENRFLETDRRRLEIDPPFSLQQFEPAALLALRETGTYRIQIPELAFDLV